MRTKNVGKIFATAFFLFWLRPDGVPAAPFLCDTSDQVGAGVNLPANDTISGVECSNRSLILLPGPAFGGGNLSINAGTLINVGPGVLQPPGILQLKVGATLNVGLAVGLDPGTLKNRGVIEVLPDVPLTGPRQTYLNFNSGLIENTGTINLIGTVFNAIGTTSNSGAITLQADAAGESQLNNGGTFTNNASGSVAFSGAAGTVFPTLVSNTGTFINAGAVSNLGLFATQGELRNSGTLTSTGRLEVLTGGTLNNTGILQLSGETLDNPGKLQIIAGGTLNNESGGRIEAFGEHLGVDAGARLNNKATAAIVTTGLIQNEGEIFSDGDFTLETTSVMSGDGSMSVNGGLLNVMGRMDILHFECDQGVVKGRGRIEARDNLVFGAACDATPGGSIGTLTLAGPAAGVEFNGTLEIEVGGASNYDVLEVIGAINFGSDAAIKLVFDGYTPAVGDSLDFLHADIVRGFGDVEISYVGLAPGYEFAFRPGADGSPELFTTALPGGNSSVPAPGTLALMLLGLSLVGRPLPRTKR